MINKYLYVDLECLKNFSLPLVGFITYNNLKNYIDKNNFNWTVSFDDFGNIYIEENLDVWKRCPEYKKVAVILKGGRYEKA